MVSEEVKDCHFLGVRKFMMGQYLFVVSCINS